MKNLRKVTVLTLGIFIFNMCIQTTGIIAFANNTSVNEKVLEEVNEFVETNMNTQVKMGTEELNEFIEGNVKTNTNVEMNTEEISEFNKTNIKPKVEGEIEKNNVQPKATISYSYDNPINNHKLTGDFLVKGWAKSEEPIINVEVRVDGVSKGQAILTIDSNDKTKNVFRFKVNGLANGNHTVTVIITDKANNKVEETRNIVVDNTKTIIMGQGTTTAAQMIEMLSSNNPLLSDKYIDDFVTYVINESKNEGVNHDIIFSQIMVETGYLKFGGDVKPEQNNFAGIGATGNGNVGNSFSTVEIGVRAVVQHLKAYASIEPLKLTCVDPRFNYVKRGSVIYVEYLGIQENPDGFGWAAGANYGGKIKTVINNLKSINITPSESKVLNIAIDGEYYTGNILTISAKGSPNEDTLYKLWVGNRNTGEWEILSDYSTQNSIQYLPEQSGKYSFVVHVKNKNSKKEYDDAKSVDVNVVQPKVEVSKLDITGTKIVGYKLNMSALANQQNNVLYKLWIGDRSTGKWTVLSDYSEKNKINYTPVKAGNYTFVVHAKHKYSKKEYDDAKSLDVSIGSIKSEVTKLDVTGIKMAGSKLTMSTLANPDNDTLYKLWVGDRTTGQWIVLSDYSDKKEITYTPKKAGRYTFVVHTKHKFSNKEYDDAKSVDIVVTQPSSKVASLDMSGSKMVNEEMTMKATSTPQNDTLYKLWVGDRTTGQWIVLSDYSDKKEITYTPKKAGRYTFVVHTKHKFSNKEYDDAKSVDIVVTQPSSRVASLDISGSKVINEEITMKATATPKNDTLYKLWVADRKTGVWTVVSDYSKVNTAKYIPKNVGRYTFVVHVKNVNSKKEYDDAYAKDIDVAAPTPIIKEFNVTGEAKVGATVTLNAKASPEGNILYKFWVCNRVTGEWKVISDYSEGASVNYKIPSYGTFSFVVHVKRKGITTNEPEVAENVNIIVKQDKLVVIDAGHGGRDPGAVSTFNGVNYIEKDLNMQIAVKLEQKLKKAGYNVYMTRLPFSDIYIDLAPRAKFANDLDADLFVSIHHNSYGKTSTGTEVYYSSNPVDDDVRQYLINTGHGDPNKTLAQRILKSSALSSDTSKRIATSIGIPNRGGQNNEFHVNRNTEMPSILVEAGFISNPSEAMLLAKPDTQDKIADSIMYSIYDNI